MYNRFLAWIYVLVEVATPLNVIGFTALYGSLVWVMFTIRSCLL